MQKKKKKNRNGRNARKKNKYRHVSQRETPNVNTRASIFVHIFSYKTCLHLSFRKEREKEEAAIDRESNKENRHSSERKKEKETAKIERETGKKKQ